MRKPDEKLDDFSAKPVTRSASKPPRPVSLQSTREVQTLKPLTEPVPVQTNTFTFRPNRRKQPLWFRRFIAVGGGIIVIVAIVLVSAIFVAISDSATEPEVAMNEMPDPGLMPAGAPFGFDSFSLPELATPDNDDAYVTRSHGERKPARRSNRVAHNKRRLMPPQPMQFPTPRFVPTTLVIYAENGEIKSRVEPWL